MSSNPDTHNLASQRGYDIQSYVQCSIPKSHQTNLNDNSRTPVLETVCATLQNQKSTFWRGEITHHPQYLSSS